MIIGFLLLAFTILFTILALTHLDWALLILISALPSYLIRFQILEIPLTLLELMILISFGVWLIKFLIKNYKNLFKNRKKFIPYPFSWEIILLLIISGIAVGTSGFNIHALGTWKAYFFEPILVFILIFNVFKNKKDIRKILWALLISSLVVSGFAIFQKITGLFIFNPYWAVESNRRVVSFFGYPNAVGLYLAPLSLLFTGWLFSLNWKNIHHELGKKIIISLTIISSLLAIYFARSWGAMIGFLAGLFIFGLLAGKKQRILTILLLFLALGGMYFSGLKNNSQQTKLIIQKLSFQDLSGQIRLQEWKETKEMLKAGKIITGAGLDNYQRTVKPYHQDGIFFNYDHLKNFDAVVWASSTLRTKYWQPVEIYLYPHNIILNFWSELGLVGLLLFIWLIVKYLIISLKLTLNLKREKNPEQYLSLGLLATMIVIIVHGLVDVPYFKNDLSLIFWLLFAILGMLQLNYKNSKKLKYESNSSKNNF